MKSGKSPLLFFPHLYMKWELQQTNLNIPYKHPQQELLELESHYKNLILDNILVRRLLPLVIYYWLDKYILHPNIEAHPLQQMSHHNLDHHIEWHRYHKDSRPLRRYLSTSH